MFQLLYLVKTWTTTRESVLNTVDDLDYPNFEIILLPDYSTEAIDGVKVIATGPVLPGVKRNIGVKNSSGEFCAFIDNDAYPRSDWLTSALKYFEDPEVGGVGGPGLTPEADGFMQKAGGYVLSSFMVGNLSSRYKTKSCFESDDIHSCNFIARKTVIEAAGGWNEKYWPGEDTLMCLAIKKLGKKLVESSDVVVYHHRRSLFKLAPQASFKIWGTQRILCQKVSRELRETHIFLSVSARIFLYCRFSVVFVLLVLCLYRALWCSSVSCFKLNCSCTASSKCKVAVLSLARHNSNTYHLRLFLPIGLN